MRQKPFGGLRFANSPYADYGPKIADEIWIDPNNAVGNGVGSREAGASPRSDTRRAESMEGFRMLLQPVRLKPDRLL